MSGKRSNESKQGMNQEIQVKLHYYREDNNYNGWNVWMWAEGINGIPGRQVDFIESGEEDSYGKVAIFNVHNSDDLEKIGFIVRKSERNQSFAQREGAGTGNRFLYLDSADENGCIEAYVIKGREEISLKRPIIIDFHYKRYDDGYDLWDIWVWEKYKSLKDKAGCAISFRDDNTYGTENGGKCGKVATYVCYDIEDVKKLGFLVRKYENNKWVDVDIELDRYINAKQLENDGKVDVYLAQNDLTVGFKKEDIDLSPKIIDAVFSCSKGKIEIDVELNTWINPKGEGTLDSKFELMCEDGTKIPIKEVVREEEGEKARLFSIELDDETELELFDKTYVLSFSGFEELGNFKPIISRLPVSRRKLYDHEAFNKKCIYKGDDLGVTHTKEKGRECYEFRIWAPSVDALELCLYDNDVGGDPINTYKLERSVGGTWYVKVENKDLEGKFYTYKASLGTKVVESIDPCAKAAGVNAERGAIVDLKNTNPDNWDETPRPKHRTESGNEILPIITEIHVRDYTINENSGVTKENRGKFKGLTEEGTKTKEGNSTCLDHIVEMGYTHVQLMPVADFGSVDESREDAPGNWGYDTTHWFILEGSYSSNPHDPVARIKEFKEMVQKFHEKGIGVILDVVFNHTHRTQFSPFNVFAPDYFYRIKDNGEYSKATGCSNEIASEKEMVRKYILDAVKYWAKEFKIDGFRFDVMYLLDIETMQEIRAEVDKIDPYIKLYGEGWGGVKTTIHSDQLASKKYAKQLKGIGFFDNEYSDALKGDFNKADKGFATQSGNYEHTKKVMNFIKPAPCDPEQIVNYIGSHDNLTWWDKICMGVEGKEGLNQFSEEERERLNRELDEERRSMFKQGYSMIFLRPGITFVPEGDEFLRTKNNNSNSYNAGDEINAIDWDRKDKYIQEVEHMKELVQFKKEYSELNVKRYEDIEENISVFYNMPNGVVGFCFRDHVDGCSLYVAHNANERDKSFSLGEFCEDIYIMNDREESENKGMIATDKTNIKVRAHSSVILVNRKSLESKKERGRKKYREVPQEEMIPREDHSRENVRSASML